MVLEHGLLPCPFCELQPDLIQAPNDPEWWIINCPHADCEVCPTIERKGRDIAIAAWNKRPTIETFDAAAELTVRLNNAICSACKRRWDEHDCHDVACANAQWTVSKAAVETRELQQLRRIDKAARAFVDARPGKNAGEAYAALCDVLFDGRPIEGVKQDSYHLRPRHEQAQESRLRSEVVSGISNSEKTQLASNECACSHARAAHYFETACSFENCDCVMFEEPKAMIDPTCDCTVDQQDRCSARAEPFHNPSTFRCKARSGPVTSGQTIQTILIARLGTIRNIAEGGLSERSLPEIARLAKEALQIAGSHETFDDAAELAFYRTSMPESLRWDQVDSNVKDAWRKNTQKAEVCAHQALERREYHANGTYWSGVPTIDMPCDFCGLAITAHDPRTHACPTVSAVPVNCPAVDIPHVFATKTTERMTKGTCIYCGTPKKSEACTSKISYYFWEAIHLIAFLIGGAFTLAVFWALGVMLHLWS